MTAATTDRELAFREVEVERLTLHPQNPRGRITREDVDELATSIKAQGVLSPLLVRPLDGAYQVVHGHRRLAAAKVAGLVRVPVIVRPMSDAAVLEAQLAENANREDLNPLQQAQAYARYLKATGATQEQLADRLGVTQGTVSAALALLDLPPEAHKLVADEIVTAAHGRELGRLSNHPHQLGTVISWIKHNGRGGMATSSRTVRGWVDGQLDRLEQERKDREAAAALKAAAQQEKGKAKGRSAPRRSAAEIKRTAAQALASRISRQRHLEIAVRATAIAKEAIALARQWKVPAGILVPLAHTLRLGMPITVELGDPNLTYDTLRTLQVALVGRLPGKWRRHGSAGMPIDADDALDQVAAKAWLGLWTWLTTRTRGLETQLVAAAKRRLKTAAEARAADKTAR